MSLVAQGSDHSGWLFKWTNYWKRYQNRYFVLKNGFLSYYRSQAEMGHTCRGTLNLANCRISIIDPLQFIVSNGTAQAYHIRANSESDRKLWITALTKAKFEAGELKNMGPDSSNHVEDNLSLNSYSFMPFTGDVCAESFELPPTNKHISSSPVVGTTSVANSYPSNFLNQIKEKFYDLETCERMISKQSDSLIKEIVQLEQILKILKSIPPSSINNDSALDTISNEDTLFKNQMPNLEHVCEEMRDKSTIYKVTVNAMMNSLKNFVEFSNIAYDKWQKQLSHELNQRQKLERMIEELAKQHGALERRVQHQQQLISIKAMNSRTQLEEGTNHNDFGDFPILKESEQQQQLRSNAKNSNNYDQSFSVDLSIRDDFLNDEEDVFFDAEDKDVTDGKRSFTLTLTHQQSGSQSNSNLPASMQENGGMDDRFSCGASSMEEEEEEGEEILRHKKDQSHFGSADDQNDGASLGRVRSGTDTIVHVITRNKAKSNIATETLDSKDVLSSSRSCIKTRRITIPERPNLSINLWSVMRNCIGKDLSKIPMPVNFNEPISMLQRLTEELEYSNCLDRAALCSSDQSILQMALVAAFSISSYSTTLLRTGKPFNPLLGETFEFDRCDDMGWRSVAEQIQHHPPTAALYAQSISHNWEYWEEFTMTSKFRGKYLSVTPLGITHLQFADDGNHYTWQKVTTTVHNIIVGRLWIDNHGEMQITNHRTGETCQLTYKAYTYFSRDIPRRVIGVIRNAGGTPQYMIRGTWDEKVEGAPIVKIVKANEWETGAWEVLWQKTTPPLNSEKIYNFTKFAIELNEKEEGVALTDSRNRPDQRLMELGSWDEANKQKERIEEKQRIKRKKRELLRNEEGLDHGFPPIDDQSPSNIAINDEADSHKSAARHIPVWFKEESDPQTGKSIHRFTGEYWKCKSRQKWNPVNRPDYDYDLF